MMASEPWLDVHIFNESEMARSSEYTDSYAQKLLDRVDRFGIDLLCKTRQVSAFRTVPPEYTAASWCAS